MTAATLLALARCTSLGELGETMALRLVGPSVALFRLWLSEVDGTLRLVASSGVPAGGGSYNRLDGQFGRIAQGAGKIGRIAESRSSLVVRGLRGDEAWLANPGWIARQGVRTFVGHPLVAEDRVFGVLAIFDRTLLSDEALEDLRFLAEYVAIRVSDLRARERPDSAIAPSPPVASASPPSTSDLLTRAALRAFEKQTIEAALARTGGRIFGEHGAARLLEMKPTTLASRIKALGIR